MKVFIVLALVVVVRSTVIRYAPAAAVVETGDSAQFRSEDNLGNYNFGYNEDHTSGGSFRREAGDALGNVAGSYGLKDADGRLRIVNYVADDYGFRADIQTNEPGVEPEDPSDVTINKGSAIVVESAAPGAIIAPAPVAALPAPIIAAPAAKTITTTYTASAPAVVAPVVSKSAHVFPPPAIAPVAKSSTTTVEVAHAAPAVVAAAPVISKSAHVFPAPLAAPVAKTHTTTVQVVQEPIAVPVAEPVQVAIAEPAPVHVKSAYTFPPVSAAVPVPKAAAVVPAPVAVAVPEPAPIAVKGALAFPPPAAVPIAKGAPVAAVASAPATVAVAHASPFAYTSHVAIPIEDQGPIAIEAPAKYAAVDVGAPALTYSAPLSFAGAKVAPVALSAPFTVNHVALGAPAHYSHSYIGPRTLAVKSSGFHYAHGLSPFYYGLSLIHI